MPEVISEFNRSNNSFSGVDMKASFGSKVIGELQAISYSITREKAPIYTMGSPDARAFARGKRGIAGTLIFIVFDRDALLTAMDDRYFQSDKDDIRPASRVDEVATGDLSALSLAAVGSSRQPSSPIGAGIAQSPSLIQQESELASTVGADQALAKPWYADQIPGFDITVVAANEYGALAVLKIFGAEILNEGWGISVDDLVTEKQYTYVARTVIPLTWVRPNPQVETHMPVQ